MSSLDGSWHYLLDLFVVAFVVPTRMRSFRVRMIVQSVSESLFSTEQIPKEAVLLKNSEAYPSIDMKYVGVITKGST